MTTATKPRTDVLAGLAEREEAWGEAKAEAGQLSTEFTAKLNQARALTDRRHQLITREPGLVDHQLNPLPGKDNPVAAIDAELTALGDVVDLQARMDHARKLEERAKQAAQDFTSAHLDEILAALEPQAEATAAEVVRCMAALHDAADAYLNMARRVDGLKAADRNRQHNRVVAIDTASDLVRLSRDYGTPPLPTEIR